MRVPAALFVLSGLGVCLLASRAFGQDQPSAPVLPPVRVHLASLGAPAQVTVQSPAGLRISNPAAPGAAETDPATATVCAEGNEVHVGRLTAATVRLEPAGTGDLSLEIRRARHSYAGALLLTAHRGRLSLVNETSLEQYTEGVLSGECPALFHPEAIKAMAVAARSYCYRKAFLSGTELCDTTHCQVFRGTSGIRPSIHDAVQATSGICAMYDGEVIDAVYCADCGGYTEANENAWKGARPVPYLRAVEDAPEPQGEPFCAVNRSHDWKLMVPRTRLSTLIGRIGSAAKVEITNVTESGRIRALQFLSSSAASETAGAAKGKAPARSLSGEELRKMLGYGVLKSLRFAVRETEQGLELTGHGFGHGVGLCQFGANGMGRQGYHFDDILKHYYTGVQVAAAPSVDEARARMAALKSTSRLARRPAAVSEAPAMPAMPSAPAPDTHTE